MKSKSVVKKVRNKSGIDTSVSDRLACKVGRVVDVSLRPDLDHSRTFWWSNVACIHSKLRSTRCLLHWQLVLLRNHVDSYLALISERVTRAPATALERGAKRQNPSARIMFFGGVIVPILVQSLGLILLSKLNSLQRPDRLIAGSVQTRCLLSFLIVGS